MNKEKMTKINELTLDLEDNISDIKHYKNSFSRSQRALTFWLYLDILLASIVAVFAIFHFVDALNNNSIMSVFFAFANLILFVLWSTLIGTTLKHLRLVNKKFLESVGELAVKKFILSTVREIRRDALIEQAKEIREAINDATKDSVPEVKKVRKRRKRGKYKPRKKVSKVSKVSKPKVKVVNKKSTKKPGRPPKPKKRGRPKGSKNKK